MIKKFFSKDKTWTEQLRAAFILSALFHLLAVIFSKGHHKLDEYGGIFAYTGHGLELWGDHFLNPGEFPARIRPWLQPFIYIAALSPFKGLMGENPFTLNLLIRALTSLFAFYSFFELAKSIPLFIKNKSTQIMALWVMASFWFFPYFHARPTAENLGTIFLTLALVHILKNRERFYLTGLFLAFAFFSRFQLVIMIGSLVFWLFFISREKKRLIQLTIGFLLGSILMVLLDSYYYGIFTLTPWQYWEFNIINQVASSIGESPWHYYFKKIFLKGIPPLSIIIFISSLWYWYKRPKDLFTWLMIPFLLVHCLIGHKELRFLYPMTIFLPFIFSIWVQEIKLSKNIFKVLIAINFLILPIAILKPAFSAIGLYQHIWDYKINKMHILGDFPKPLRLYLRNQSLETIQSDLEQTKTITGWFFSNKYHFYKELKEQSQCKKQYLSYPSWLLEKAPDRYRKRSKVFSLFYCQN